MGASCGCCSTTESTGSVLLSKDDAKINSIAEKMANDCLKKYAISNKDKLNKQEAMQFCKDFLPLSCNVSHGELKMNHFRVQKDSAEMDELAGKLFE